MNTKHDSFSSSVFLLRALPRYHWSREIAPLTQNGGSCRLLLLSYIKWVGSTPVWGLPHSLVALFSVSQHHWHLLTQLPWGQARSGSLFCFCDNLDKQSSPLVMTHWSDSFEMPGLPTRPQTSQGQGSHLFAHTVWPPSAQTRAEEHVAE